MAMIIYIYTFTAEQLFETGFLTEIRDKDDTVAQYQEKENGQSESNIKIFIPWTAIIVTGLIAFCLLNKKN
jgi:hypothetical protein